MGCPSLSVHPLGTEGWDGQLGQGPTGGTPWDVPHCPYIPWGLRDGTDNWDRGLQVGLRGMSLTVRTSLGDCGMGRSWDRGLRRGLHGIVMYILLFSVPCYRTHGSPKFPLDSRWQYWTTLKKYANKVGIMRESKGQHIGKAPSLHLFHTAVRQCSKFIHDMDPQGYSQHA